MIKYVQIMFLYSQIINQQKLIYEYFYGFLLILTQVYSLYTRKFYINCKQKIIIQVFICKMNIINNLFIYSIAIINSTVFDLNIV